MPTRVTESYALRRLGIIVYFPAVDLRSRIAGQRRAGRARYLHLKSRCGVDLERERAIVRTAQTERIENASRVGRRVDAEKVDEPGVGGCRVRNASAVRLGGRVLDLCPGKRQTEFGSEVVVIEEELYR